MFLNTYSLCGSKVDSIPIHIQGGTGINDLELNNSIKVYPNPAQNSINIETINDALIQEISMLNAVGQVVFFDKYKNARNVKLDLDKYNSGIYQLLLKTNNGFVTKKITIVK